MSNTEAKNTASAFSYAQAAKSSAATSTKASFSSKDTSGSTTPSKDVSFSVESKHEFAATAGSSEGGKTAGDDVKVSGTDSTSYNLNANVPASPTYTSKEEETSASKLSKDWREGRPKQTEHGDEKSRRKGKKGRRNEKKENTEEPAEEPKPVEILIAAPPPSVNIWQQRAQAARKPEPVQSEQAVPETPKAAEKKPVKTEAKSSAESTKDAKSQTPKKEGAKPKEDVKRSVPRGSRQGEKGDKASQPPPSVDDSMSWPTPEIATEKIKAQEKEKSEKAEKKDDDGEASSSKQPRQKQSWVSVPYTPTVAFNTPLPGSTRGNRGRGGTRPGTTRDGNTGRGGASMGDKGMASTTANSPDSRERGRANSNTRASSLPPNASKKFGETTYRDVRDARKPPGYEKPKVEDADASAKAGGSPTAQSSRQANGSSPASEAHAHPQSFSQELNAGSLEFHKDASNHQGREQSGRGRGGYRGNMRGGNHTNYVNGHQYNNVQQPMSAFGLRPTSTSFSPPQQQQPFMGGHSGRGRGGPRVGMSNANPVYRQQPHGAQMAPITTSPPMYDYSATMQSMSAIPYAPFVEQYSVLSMVTMQLEYYFSIDNLCKDMFLRRHMDSQGFVYLTIIAGFKRIQSLTQDIDMLRYACQESETVEIVIGEDGINRLRRADGWDKWVMPMEERDESARNAGPKQFLVLQKINRHQPMARAASLGQAVPMPQMLPNGAQMYPGYVTPMAAMTSPIGHQNSVPSYPQSALSAAVPEFAPLQSFKPEDYVDAEVTFKDDELDHLNVVYSEKTPGASGESPVPKVPFHLASSRTFSNGSIDARMVTEEFDKQQKEVNGSQSS